MNNKLRILSITLAVLARLHPLAAQSSPVKTSASARVTIQTNGYGHVSPDYNGKLLVIGNTYHVTSIAALGNMVTGWSGSLSGTNSTLSFVMQSGLVLTANFATNLMPVSAAITVPRTTLVQGSYLQVNVVVTNWGTQPAYGVNVYSQGEGLDLVEGGGGFSDPIKTIAPGIAMIAAGKSRVFSQTFKATTPGLIEFYGVVGSSYGVTPSLTSPVVTVVPPRTGMTAMTDDSGNALLILGGKTMPIQIIDEDTGSPISGLAVAVVQDRKKPSRAVMVVADSFERYPLQLIELRGAARKSVSVAPPSPVTVPVQSTLAASAGGAIQLLQTGFLPSFIEAASDNENFPPLVLEVLQALASSKNLVLPPGLQSVLPSVKPTQVLPSGQLISVLQQKIADQPPIASVSCILETSELLEAAADTATDLSPNIFNLITANVYQELGYTQLSLVEVEYGGFVFEMVVPASASQPTDSLTTGNVQISAQDSNGQPISGGSLELLNQNVLGLDIVEVLDTVGSANVPVPIGTYNERVRAAGFQPFTNQITVTEAGANIAATLIAQPIASGTLMASQLTGFLPEGTTFAVTPQFLDADGNEVGCAGTNRPIFMAHNPVGTTVATVDPDTGLVTIQGGCGAAGITAWCSGVETRRLLVSSDCNGSQPPKPPVTFALNPTALTFSATENGANPPQQPVYIVTLKNGSLNYDQYKNTSWITFGSHVDGADYFGVNISGLSGGSYHGSVTYTDTNSPVNHATVSVTLIVKPIPPANVEGMWRGSYTVPFDDVGDEADFNVVWVLNQSGTRVSGDYGEIEAGSPQQNGTLSDGLIRGNDFSIYDDGGLEFVGTISADGKTISGSVETGSNFPGTFSVTKQ